MQDNFSIRDWKHETVYKEEFEGASKVAEVEDFEADAEDIEFEIPGDENAKPVVDKDLNKSLSKQDKIIQDFKRIQDQMKTHLELYKTSESEENKKTALQMLKNLTPEFQAAKKAYEKLKGVKL